MAAILALAAAAAIGLGRRSAETVLGVPRPRPAGASVRVGLQVGHWRPDTPNGRGARPAGGAEAGGVSEVAISYPIAQRVAARLRRDGIRADILPVTVPPGYEADAFVALHADGSRSARPRGYKVAASDWGPPQGAALAEALSEEYAAATGLPWHDVITRDMRRYYAFNYRRSRYAVTPSTPAVILELGFVSNPEDRSVMTNRADAVVEGVYRGLRRYLGARGE